MMSKSDFDVTSMGERQEITFLIMPDEKTTYNSLVTMFLKQSYELLIAKAEECGGENFRSASTGYWKKQEISRQFQTSRV